MMSVPNIVDKGAAKVERNSFFSHEVLEPLLIHIARILADEYLERMKCTTKEMNSAVERGNE